MSGFTGQVLSTRCRRTTVPQVVTLIAGSKRRSLLMAGDDEEMFMTKNLNLTPKITEQHLNARSDKSVAYVTNNKRLCSTFCAVEANYWQTRSIARPLCDSYLSCSLLRLQMRMIELWSVVFGVTLSLPVINKIHWRVTFCRPSTTINKDRC